MEKSGLSLKLFDFLMINLSFIIPAFIFEGKAFLGVQILLGMTCALITLGSQVFSRFGIYRGSLPLIENTYSFMYGLILSFFTLGIISFINYNPNFQFSRFVNISAFGICIAYALVSRKIVFKHLKITTIELKTSQIVSEDVYPIKKASGFGDNGPMDYVEINNRQLTIATTNKKYIGFSDLGFPIVFSRVRLINHKPVLEIVENPDDIIDFKYHMLAKRICDIFLALIAIPFALLPVLMASIYLAIRYRGNPIFAQERVGKNQKTFTMYKLKTFWGDPPQINRDCLILRKFAIDELPQLFNILLGDMSFVGPRAELVSKAEAFGEMSELRHSVPPGLTGYWQLSPFRHKWINEHIEYDMFYVFTRSLLIDLIVVFLTPFFMFSKKT